jgi:hypothetical protein
MLVQEIAPRIRGSLSNAAQVGADDPAELAQDGIAIAAALLASAEARGKKVSAGNVAFYATRLLRQGRRSGGQSTTDVLSPRTQITGRCRLESIDQPIAAGEAEGDNLCLHDVLAAGSADPSQEAAQRLDWEAFIATLDELARTILQCLAEERPLLEVAHAAGVSRSTLQTYKDRLTTAVQAFMGPELMQDLQRPPQRRINLRAVREKMACRYARSLA